MALGLPPHYPQMWLLKSPHDISNCRAMQGLIPILIITHNYFIKSHLYSSNHHSCRLHPLKPPIYPIEPFSLALNHSRPRGLLPRSRRAFAHRRRLDSTRPARSSPAPALDAQAPGIVVYHGLHASYPLVTSVYPGYSWVNH